MKRWLLWIGLMALLPTACGSEESERERCVRLCEKQVTCQPAFDLATCRQWCRTLEDEGNDRVLHPQMTACLSEEDCPDFLACVSAAREFLGVSPAQRIRPAEAGDGP